MRVAGEEASKGAAARRFVFRGQCQGSKRAAAIAKVWAGTWPVLTAGDWLVSDLVVVALDASCARSGPESRRCWALSRTTSLMHGPHFPREPTAHWREARCWRLATM